ncbi:MAG: hypothetical protein R3F30_00670 [Planctomycetota bacterium]
MRLLQGWFGRRGKKLRLGLADPGHPARKWIDAASVIIERRLELQVIDDETRIKTDGPAATDLLGALDMALSAAPADADLMVIRSAVYRLLDRSTEAEKDIEQALRSDPLHTEATLVKKYGTAWNSLLFSPPWSERAKTLHPVLVHKANQGSPLQCVLHGLQPALSLTIVGGRDQLEGSVRRFDWQVFENRTPSGTIGAHYLLAEMPDGTRRQELFLVPPEQSTAGKSEPVPLYERLPAARTCFLVIVEPSGQVIHNLRLDLPESTRRVLSKLSQSLLRQAGMPLTVSQQAVEWYMRNVEVESIEIPS